MFAKFRQGVADWVLRDKIKPHTTPLNRFRVVVARTTQEYEDAFRLLHVAYVYQGIEGVRSPKMRITRQHVLPEATVFVAYEGEKCVGTVTVTGDSPVGLPLDRDYPQELAALREASKLAEIGSYAVVGDCKGSGVSLLLVIAANHWAINKLRATEVAIGVNPQAVGYYRALYGYAPFARAQQHAELAAPVIGLHVRFDDMLEHARRHLPQRWASGLTIAEHWSGVLPSCIRIPQTIPESELARWKLPRTVFQELFIEKSDRLANLDSDTMDYLTRYRSEMTLTPPLHGRSLCFVCTNPQNAGE